MSDDRAPPESSMETVLLSAAVVMILATLVPTLRDDWWLIRIFEFPRVQVAVLCILTAIWFAAEWQADSAVKTVLLAGLGACVIYQGYRIFPFTPLAKVEMIAVGLQDDRCSVRLLISNVLMTNRNAEPLLKLIRERDPDVVFCVECDEWWAERLKILDQDYPYRLAEPRDDTYGMVFYSRLPFVEAEIRHLRKEYAPSIKACLETPGGMRFRLYGLHPEPPYPKFATRTTQRDAELLTVAKEIEQEEQPAIVVGDLNDVAWSYTTRLFQKISGCLDPRVGRSQLSTFPADFPFMRFPLDHVFASDDFRLIKLERLPHVGSDHFPVFVHLQFDAMAPALQEEPEVEAEDRELVEEKLERADRTRGEEAPYDFLQD